MSNLWKPPNIHSLPTPSETKLAKEDIESLELQLQSALAVLLQAQHVVKTLQQNIEEKRAWIAPIRRISHDVLSLIFLEACRMNSSAPLILGQVCQVWRESIITYPRAWSYFQLQDGQSNELRSLFISRSAPCSLHLRLPSLFDSGASELLASVSERIQCLSLGMDQVRNLQGYLFPEIERLDIDGHMYGNASGQDSGFILNYALFPRLRSLNAGTLLESIKWDTPPFPNVVPLQILSITAKDTNTWGSILGCCSQTLTSLAVVLYPLAVDVPVPSRKTIALPRLKSLHITHGGRSPPAGWPVDMRTPALQIYLEISMESRFLGPIYEDTQTVTSLRCNVDIDLSKFPRVRQMVIRAPGALHNVVQRLVNAPSMCPNLATIVYGLSNAEDLIRAETRIAARNRQTGGNIQFRGSDDDDIIFYQHPRVQKCGYNMPCAHRG